jgi:hypothetical protein
MDDSILSISGRQLPGSSKIITRSRDIVVLDLPALAKPLTFTRTAVILDPSADPRIFDVLLALHHRSLHFRANLVGLAKVAGGRLRWWYGDPDTEQHARVPVQQAIQSALFPFDNWVA